MDPAPDISKKQIFPSRPSTLSQVRHYRFTYYKGPAVRFLGHLDMMAVFTRACIAAGFELQYSQGFKPHPRISFGPPLPFAVLGDAEAFDLAVEVPIDGEPLRINAMLPRDLHAFSCKALNGTEGSVTSSVVAGRYRITSENPFDISVLTASIQSVISQKSLPITISKNGFDKTKDLRPLIHGLHLDSDGSIDALLALRPGATCRPSELVALLFPGRAFTEFMIIRRVCLPAVP
jgi:radical SAM-linked protein